MRYRGAFEAALAKSVTEHEAVGYADVLLARLLMLYTLQARGFLGRGDRWYLHSHLGACQAPATNRFYRSFFMPLCHQGIALPESERPLQQQQWGSLPYLGSRLFYAHPVEQQHPSLELPDEPFEAVLGWLAEQRWQETLEDWTDGTLSPAILAAAYEYWITGQTGKAVVSLPETLQGICDRTVDAHILHAIHRYEGQRVASVATLLAELEDDTCHLLLDKILPSLTILDPACGTGRLLLMALTRLQQIYQACLHQAQRSSHPALRGWLHGLQQEAAPMPWTLTRRILTQNLYGVDLRPEVIFLTQFQLWLALLATAETAADLRPLPDLDFNLVVGNALVGFIRVDEEGFDQIVPKQGRSVAIAETVLQGNLLQPLMAASYRDTVAERQICVEHYQAQTRAMEEASGIPEYVQTDFLRDRIQEVNYTAQRKLNRLLWETASQKLGIQVRSPQVGFGRARRRLLTLADIEALQPFHWGFFFNRVLEQRGGFDVVLTHPPGGALRPSADDFYRQYALLLLHHGIDRDTFRRSRKVLLQKHPVLAARWRTYVEGIAAMRDYLRRSQEYQLQSPVSSRSVSLKAAFAQRCGMLVRKGGVSPYLYLK